MSYSCVVGLDDECEERRGGNTGEPQRKMGAYTPHAHTLNEQIRTVAETLIDKQGRRLRRHQHKVDLHSFLALALRTEAVNERPQLKLFP